LQDLKTVPISSDGSSLLDLRDAAKRLGVDTEIRRYRPEQIDYVPLPAIGQFRTGKDSITPLHIDVIYKVDADRVYLLNGTTGAEYWILRSRLPYFWEGFAVVRKQSRAAFIVQKWRYPILITALIVIDGFILAFWLSKRKRAKP
jgi:ABC-type bacteriocin/lantibiotic exporter with double-glycine peptidase domain